MIVLSDNMAASILKASGCDAVLVLAQSNTQYLSGYESSNAFIVITADENYYITDKRYSHEAYERLNRVFTVKDGDLYSIKNILVEHNCKRVGWDDTISYFEYKRLFDIMSSSFEMKEISDLMLQLRSIKSKGEINIIKKAQDLTDKAYDYILTKVKIGISEIELAADLEHYILRNGGSLAFDTIAAFGENGAKPHCHRSDRVLKNGDFVTLDFGARVDGYCSDMTRTFAIGNISNKMAEVYNSVLEAHIKALENIQVGMTGRECDAIAREVLEKKGLGVYFTHSLGHGVGVEIHEKPYLSPNSNEILCNGHVVTVEPGVYINNEFGVRIEDTIVIESNKAVSLTRSDKKLIILN